ncbi:MAG: hypothetical protein QOH36_1920 [Actinomycetota bacterium]|nr:hypothetical protein [Actinomycetota bacterium]
MLLGGEEIRRHLAELGDDLSSAGVRGELFIVGGAAMALAYNTRRSTRDIDAVFEPKTLVYQAARRVAERHPDLPTDWLNDAVKGFLLGEDPAATVVFDHPGLRVRVASPRYLFVMKLAASRVERDTDDIVALHRFSGFEGVDDALGYVERTYPHLVLAPRVRYLLEELDAAQLLGPGHTTP